MSATTNLKLFRDIKITLEVAFGVTGQDDRCIELYKSTARKLIDRLETAIRIERQQFSCNLVLRCCRGGKFHFRTDAGVDTWTTDPEKAQRYTLPEARAAKGRSRSLILHESKMLKDYV